MRGTSSQPAGKGCCHPLAMGNICAWVMCWKVGYILLSLCFYHLRPKKKTHQYQSLKRFVLVFLHTVAQGTASVSPYSHTCVCMGMCACCCESKVLLVFSGSIPH